MKKFDLNDFLKNIEALINEKKEIDTKINTLAGAATIMYPDENVSEKLKTLNYFIDSNVVMEKGNKYSTISTKDSIKDVLEISDRTSETDILKLLFEGGKKVKDSTLKTELSRLVAANEIKRDKDGNENYYDLIREDEKREAISSNNLAKHKTEKKPIQTNACVEVIKDFPGLDKDSILSKLIERKFDFGDKTGDLDANRLSVGNALNALLHGKKKLIRAETKGRMNIYFINSKQD